MAINRTTTENLVFDFSKTNFSVFDKEAKELLSRLRSSSNQFLRDLSNDIVDTTTAMKRNFSAAGADDWTNALARVVLLQKSIATHVQQGNEYSLKQIDLLKERIEIEYELSK